MERWLGPWSEHCDAVLRIVVALLFLNAATQKLCGFPGGPAVVGNRLLQTAGVLELFTGSLIGVV